MHTKIPGSGLTTRARQAPATCMPATGRKIVSVVSPAPAPKHQQQQSRDASHNLVNLITVTEYDRNTRAPCTGYCTGSKVFKTLHGIGARAACTSACAAGPSSHCIELSDASGGESDTEDVKQLRHGNSSTKGALHSRRFAVSGAAATAEDTATGSGASKIRHRRQRKRPATGNSKQQAAPEAAAAVSTAISAVSALAGTINGSPTPQQKQPACSQRSSFNKGLQKQHRASAVRKFSAAATALLVLVAASTASSTARTFLGQFATLTSSSSSTGGVPAAAAVGSTSWGALGGWIGSTFRAAQFATPAYRSPAAAAAAPEAGYSNAAVAGVAGRYASWLSSSSKALRALQIISSAISSRSASILTSNNYDGSSRSSKVRPAAAAGSTTVTAVDSNPDNSNVVPAGELIKMYAVIDDSATSPYKGATWGAVISHIAKRLAWNNPRFSLEVLTQQKLKSDSSARDSLAAALNGGTGSSSSSSRATPIFVGISVTDPDVAAFLGQATAKLPTALFWDSVGDLDKSSRVDSYAPATAPPFAQLLAAKVGFSSEAKASKVLKTIDSLWGRHTSDDLLFIWLVLLNEYVTPVPEVANTTKGTDLQSLFCMIKNCGSKIQDCVTDTTCKAGLDCLEGCAFNDQVCQYRCIVSYETPKFEQFALCILQLHNCRGLDAKMPMMPDPAPMSAWHGKPLTHEVAESLFIGWKEAGPQMPQGGQVKPYSWLVAAGKNPAYDFFPCQHQLYSYGKGKGQMWYEPVFKAITLDGQEVWRRRRYRVRRGTTPGTFYYSVLDNGVTSNEYWRIMDCAEDLTYCLFYYSGAAAAAGLSYSGAVLASNDGLWPAAYTERIHEALGRAGIEPWELSLVDNSACVGAPL